MAGEMYEVDSKEWPLHVAVCETLRDEGYEVRLQPFDVYQGPYIVVGGDVRVGQAPYQYCPPGPTRIWIGDGVVYREDTGESVPVIPLEHVVSSAALILMDGGRDEDRR